MGSWVVSSVKKDLIAANGFTFASRFLMRMLKRIGYCFGALFVVTFVVVDVSGVDVRLPVTTVGKSGVPSPISDAMVRRKGRGKATGIPRAKEIALNLGSNAEK